MFSTTRCLPLRTTTGLLCTAAATAIAQPAEYRETAPARGAWLRPPSIQTFEQYVPILADAGIQDIYLETFYHGLATNDSDVFKDRFTFDYLAEAIEIAARSSVRVHAWIETGYWQFGSTGAYLFTENPEWRVEHVSDPTKKGDIAGQVFANLAHPGVRAKLAEYAAELAAVPGLAGIHIDYHRFPVGPSGEGPWSYDDWSRDAFEDDFGVDPLIEVDDPGDPLWEVFVQWRRDRISETAQAMFDAILPVNPQIDYSAAVFASAPTSQTQLAKMQDWPAWANGGYLDTVIPMAYGPTTGSIKNDVQLTLDLAPKTRVVVGLAVTGQSPHPDVDDQLTAITEKGLEDFVIFDAEAIVFDSSKQDLLRDWLADNATPQWGDFDENGYVDARDRETLEFVYQGDPFQTTSLTEPFDLNQDGWIDDADVAEFDHIFVANRFGPPPLDLLDAKAFFNSFTGSWSGPPPGEDEILHLYDHDGDGDVDFDDFALVGPNLGKILNAR